MYILTFARSQFAFAPSFTVTAINGNKKSRINYVDNLFFFLFFLFLFRSFAPSRRVCVCLSIGQEVKKAHPLYMTLFIRLCVCVCSFFLF